jgi:hypothetical protein
MKKGETVRKSEKSEQPSLAVKERRIIPATIGISGESADYEKRVQSFNEADNRAEDRKRMRHRSDRACGTAENQRRISPQTPPWNAGSTLITNAVQPSGILAISAPKEVMIPS